MIVKLRIPAVLLVDGEFEVEIETDEKTWAAAKEDSWIMRGLIHDGNKRVTSLDMDLKHADIDFFDEAIAEEV